MTIPRERKPGWRLGSVGGSPVYLAPSWLLVAAILTALFLPTVRAWAPQLSGPGTVLAATAFPIGLFASVFAHELAHGGVARACRVRVREYVLTFWGGHTSFGDDLRTPGISAAVSVAGPLANLVLAGSGYLLLQALPLGLPAVLLASLVWANLVVAIFNLLPGNPLDGGRILEALIWKVSGDRNTGAIGAGWVGRVLAVGVVLGALGYPLLRGSQPTLTNAIWGVLIAGMVWNGASQSIRIGRARRSAAGFDLRGLIRPSTVLSASAPVAAIPATPWGMAASEVVLTDQVGTPVALVDHSALASVPLPARASTPLTALARPLPPAAIITAVTGPDSLAQVARGLGAASTLVVVLPQGIAGTVDRAQLLAALRPDRTQG